MLSCGFDTSYKQDFTAADLIADLSLVDWESLAFMDTFIDDDDELMLGSDDETTLEQLSELIENPVLLDHLVGDAFNTPTSTSSASSLPVSRQYDVLLSQQHETTSNNQLQQQTQHFIQQQQQQQQQLINQQQQQKIQHQQNLAYPQQQQHFQPPVPIHEASNDPSNFSFHAQLLPVTNFHQAKNAYLSFQQTYTQPASMQPSSFNYDTYPTLPSATQTPQITHFTSSFNVHPSSAPAAMQRPSIPFHPMNYHPSDLQPTSTQSSPQHKTFNDTSPLPARSMPDVTELWDYFSYCHQQVSLKNTANTPSFYQRPSPAKSLVESAKNRRYKSHRSLSDIYPLSSEYEPPGKKLRQNSLDDRKSEIANILEFEDVKSIGRSTGSSPESAVEKIPTKGDQLCSVCGDNAVCLHYGARTCEGCKGFFKRTVQKKAKYVCLEESKCPVDKRRRNRCQFCRFQKCLSVGMQREVVRMDTLKGRRGRLPTKASSSLPSIKNISSELVKIHMEKETSQKSIFTEKILSKNKYNRNQCTNIAHPDDEHQIRNIFNSDFDIISGFYEHLTSSLDSLEAWAEKVQSLTSLQSHDKKLLFDSAFLELFALNVVKKIDRNEGMFEMGGKMLERSEFPQVFAEWLERVYSFVAPLKRLCLDLPSAAHLEALLLFSDHRALKDAEKVTDMQAIVCSSLQEHIFNTYETSSVSRAPVFSHILGKMSSFKNLKEDSVQLLAKLNYILPLPDSLEKFLMDLNV